MLTICFHLIRSDRLINQAKKRTSEILAKSITKSIFITSPKSTPLRSVGGSEIIFIPIGVSALVHHYPSFPEVPNEQPMSKPDAN